MKKIKTISIILIIIQLVTIIINLNNVKANINEGDTIQLLGDHECDSLLEYWMTDNKKWSYKIVWYVYYIDSQTGNRYPAFCVEPSKEGVGTGYNSYSTTISRENDNGIWRILSKGYMGSNYINWNLECDDDLYSATKVAIHSYVERVSPKNKYILGNRSVDGNTVEEIQRRGAKVLEVAQTLYEYGLNGIEVYETPQVDIEAIEENKVETINKEEYYIQKYKIISNRPVHSYNISIENFVEGTKVLDSNNNEISNSNSNYFKIAIPTKNITENINGKININEAQVKTCPIFYAKSTIPKAQSYVTYTNGYETAYTSTNLNIDAHTSELLITKIDSETKNPLPNVTFKITDKDGKELGEYTTDETGIIEIQGLKPGLVKIKEIKVDDKYILDGEEKEVELQWEKKTEIEIENDRKKGQIKIIKVSEDNNQLTGQKAGTPIQNVEFEIRDEKGDLIEIVTTNEEGIAISSKLEKGKYSIKEIKADQNYELDDNEYIIEILENKQIVELLITNKSKKLPRTGF